MVSHIAVWKAMRLFVFQDRCLKPLGHPSIRATSII